MSLPRYNLRYLLRMNAVRMAVIAGAVALAVLQAACARQTPPVAGPGDLGRSGVAEGTLEGGSSLARARQGLPPEEDGLLKDVRFGLDSYSLSKEARAVLDANALWLKENRRVSLEIEGHADERGTIEYNLALGARRAKAVQDYLTVMGINARRMATISYGEELPVCRKAMEECWRRNRRAHFVILNP